MTTPDHRGAVAPSAPRPVGPRAAPPRQRPPVPKATHERPLLRNIPSGIRVADAYLALAMLALGEILVVGLASLRQFAGPFELALATLFLLPLALAAAAPAALVCGLLVEALRSGARLTGRLIASLCALLFAGAVAFGVSGGRFFEGGRRVPFVAMVALIAAGATFALAPVLARVLERARGRAGAARLVGVVVLLVAAVELANARILPRLYPAFHLGLGALTLFIGSMGALAFVALAAPRSARVLSAELVRAALALGLFALGAALSPGAAARLAPMDNARLVFLERAPLAAHLVALGAELSPPPPLDDLELREARAGQHAIDLDGRDLLLITVDALRADHVGAYGYKRPVTPNIDALAQGGVVFDAAYSPTPHTSYAVTSLMTGKYMRPLILQGLGADSETFASHLRHYGYRTAAFYPPAVFFIDPERFESMRDRGLDFEYRKVEFADVSLRVEQVRSYLEAQKGQRLFLWVHLFEPHEPYVAHPEHAFGDRDIDRYDGEIAAADAGVGAIVEAVRRDRPGAVVIVSADHGEEFSDHGGRYHGTTVYEEQVRVPLIFNAPELFEPHRVSQPVQIVDLLPTVLEGLRIPRPARVRGNDLGPALAGRAAPDDVGFAFAESETQTLLAKGPRRLVCARKIGACALYDVNADPGETVDIASSRPADVASMRAELRMIEASHGRYERQGLRSEGKGWPEALRRGIAGDGDAAADVAALLDDADVAIRRKAAEVLFELRRPEVAAPLRLALVRDEDEEVRRFAALALTRLGEGAPLTRELVKGADLEFRRLAALALAEAGDNRGIDVLLAWWRAAFPAKDKDTNETPRPKETVSFERAREIAAALGKTRSKYAVGPLIASLDDVRLRPYVARALAAIGQDAARPALAERFENERYHETRIALAESLVELGAGPELRLPLVRFLGTPDPLPDGLRIALQADVLDLIGGPRERDLVRLRRFATSGVAVGVVVPKGGNNTGLRAICRARSLDQRAGQIRVGRRAGPPPGKRDGRSPVPSDAPELDLQRATTLTVPAAEGFREVFATLPASVSVRPGTFGDFVVYATQNVEVVACAVVPLSDDLPPPPPMPWTPDNGQVH